MKIETSEQIQLVKAIRQYFPKLFFFAVPNEAYRAGIKEKKEAAIKGYLYKRMGVVAGIPDLCFPSIKTFIELKKPKTYLSNPGKLSDKQKEVKEIVESFGWVVLICYGAADAFEKLKDVYLNYLKQ